MSAIAHMQFIGAAYGAAFLIALSLVAWVLLDHRSLRQKLAELESRGATRRSERGRNP